MRGTGGHISANHFGYEGKPLCMLSASRPSGRAVHCAGGGGRTEYEELLIAYGRGLTIIVFVC